MLVDFLLENFNIVQFLRQRNYTAERIGGRTGYLGDCPFCGKEGHLGVNAESKTFGCYKCRRAGSCVKLIQKILNTDFSGAVEFLKEGVDLKNCNLAYIEGTLNFVKEHRNLEKQVRPIGLPVGYQSLQDRRISYLDKRSTTCAGPISQDQVNYYRMGYCGTGRYKNRLIVCDVNEDQTPIYWVARDITGQVKKKDKLWNPPATEGSAGSSDILFNFSLAKNYDTVIITEGVFDALWVGNNAVATYGKGVKGSHPYWLIKGGFKEAVLLYDADVCDAELEKDANKIAAFLPVRVCKLPFGDPDEFQKEVLWQYINNAPYFSTRKIVLR